MRIVEFTKNLSLSNAALFTTLAAEVGSFVRVKSEQYNVSIIAVVRDRRNGQDGIPSLHIEFIDRFFRLKVSSKVRTCHYLKKSV